MPETFFANLAALHREAKMWADEPLRGRAVDGEPPTIFTGDVEGRSMAEVAGASAEAVEAMPLTSIDLSWAAVETGLLETYEELRAKTASLLREAASNFEATAETLLAVAAAYSRTDTESAQAIREVWVPTPRNPDPVEGAGGGR